VIGVRSLWGWGSGGWGIFFDFISRIISFVMHLAKGDQKIDLNKL
jgi:hypothetical protein